MSSPSVPNPFRLEERVLVLASHNGDEALCHDILRKARLAGQSCRDLGELLQELARGAGAVFITEDALAAAPREQLARAMQFQPEWSDIPVILLASQSDSPLTDWAVQTLGSITVLERPIRVISAVTALRGALRARAGQYQLREHLRAQGLLAAIVESSDDAIISKTLDGVVMSWNAGAERLLGFAADEVVGQPIYRLIPEAQRDEERQLLDRLGQGERIAHFETIRVAKSGRRVDVSLTLSPVRDSRGDIIGVSTVARDITLRQRQEAALREADRRKDQFLATLAHELRNPLAPIRNAIHILRLAGERETFPHHLIPVMERQVEHLIRLVDDLMEVSRIGQGKVELRQERVELADIIRSAVEISRPLIDAGRHELYLNLPLGPVRLMADPVRLTQIVANLLNNAARFTPQGGKIWLAAALYGATAVISVRDNGIGIPADLLPGVFDLFVQGNAGHQQSGLGIGLTLVQHLVRLHGGSVEARSEGAGQGSEFILRLSAIPRAVRAPQDLATDDPGHPAATNARRILVVDDSRDAAESLAELLRMMGHDVQLAYEGSAAIAAAERYHPDVAVLDLAMPGMDGFELARRLRRNPQFDRLRLIALTGFGQEDFRRRAREAGFDAHFVKPADLAELDQALTAN